MKRLRDHEAITGIKARLQLIVVKLGRPFQGARSGFGDWRSNKNKQLETLDFIEQELAIVE
jgi:hypothetical protein